MHKNVVIEEASGMDANITFPWTKKNQEVSVEEMKTKIVCKVFICAHNCYVFKYTIYLCLRLSKVILAITGLWTLEKGWTLENIILKKSGIWKMLNYSITLAKQATPVVKFRVLFSLVFHCPNTMFAAYASRPPFFLYTFRQKINRFDISSILLLAKRHFQFPPSMYICEILSILDVSSRALHFPFFCYQNSRKIISSTFS